MKNAILLIAAAATLMSIGTAAPVFAKKPSGNIPPNCTLDPWTGKMTCHQWPKK